MKESWAQKDGGAITEIEADPLGNEVKKPSSYTLQKQSMAR